MSRAQLHELLRVVRNNHSLRFLGIEFYKPVYQPLMDFFKISINNVSCVLRCINCYIKRLFFSNNGLWHDHIDYIVKKAYTRLTMLRKVRFKLNRFTLEKMYFSLIRPILGQLYQATNFSYIQVLDC
jgi:hypothetical protein